jgi:hypothetical protein
LTVAREGRGAGAGRQRHSRLRLIEIDGSWSALVQVAGENYLISLGYDSAFSLSVL